MKAILNIKKWAHKVALKTFIGTLVFHLKPSIKKELTLFLMVMMGGYIGYRIDTLLLPMQEYGRALVIGYFCLLGYSIRYIQAEVIAKLWNKQDDDLSL